MKKVNANVYEVNMGNVFSYFFSNLEMNVMATSMLDIDVTDDYYQENYFETDIETNLIYGGRTHGSLSTFGSEDTKDFYINLTKKFLL
jgi:hypothetical protein